MRKIENSLYITFPALTENEKISRMVGAAFLAELNPTIEELDDVKTAISEAVTNAIIHGYEQDQSEKPGKRGSKIEQPQMDDAQKEDCMIYMTCLRRNREVTFIIEDRGKGIPDIKQAMEPLFTTKTQEERSGMGFSFMEAFMDQVEVESALGEGTKVVLVKRLGGRSDDGK